MTDCYYTTLKDWTIHKMTLLTYVLNVIGYNKDTLEVQERDILLELYSKL